MSYLFLSCTEINYLTAQFLLPYILSSKMGLNRICIINNKFKICATNLIKFMLYNDIVMIKICLFLIKQACLKAKVRNTEQDFFNHYINFSVKNSSVHDKFHRTLILSGFCLLKIAKISLNSSFFPKPIKR